MRLQGRQRDGRHDGDHGHADEQFQRRQNPRRRPRRVYLFWKSSFIFLKALFLAITFGVQACEHAAYECTLDATL